MNDTLWWIARGLKGLFKLPRCEGIARCFLEKVEPWPAGSQEGQTKEKTKWIATKAQTRKIDQLLIKSWMCTENKIGRWSILRDRKVIRLGVSQAVCSFSLNIWKLELTRGFSPGKKCNLMIVRGTISFYNQRLQIFPVGGSAMWNVSMWLNERCWMWTISFSAVSH